MRKRCLNMVYELAKKDPRILFVGSDLGHGTLDEFKEEMPERFFMEGISEASVIGMAAGLAMRGKIPYVNTIATFFTRRALEQIAVDLCMHKAKVRIIGNGGGTVYAPLGSTHLALEDISLMRALPNMTVTAVCDADEMERLMPQTVDVPGPTYIRLGKGYDEIVSRPENGFELGRAIHYRKGTDALIVTTGVGLQEAVGAAELLDGAGVSCGIMHVHTVKPLDTEQLLDAMADVPVIVVAEENTVYGGLGSAVAELVAEAGFNPAKRFKRIGIPDIFPDVYGTQKEIMADFGLSPTGLRDAVAGLMGKTA